MFCPPPWLCAAQSYTRASYAGRRRRAADYARTCSSSGCLQCARVAPAMRIISTQSTCAALQLNWLPEHATTRASPKPNGSPRTVAVRHLAQHVHSNSQRTQRRVYIVHAAHAQRAYTMHTQCMRSAHARRAHSGSSVAARYASASCGVWSCSRRHKYLMPCGRFRWCTTHAASPGT